MMENKEKHLLALTVSQDTQKKSPRDSSFQSFYDKRCLNVNWNSQDLLLEALGKGPAFETEVQISYEKIGYYWTNVGTDEFVWPLGVVELLVGWWIKTRMWCVVNDYNNQTGHHCVFV